MSVGGGLLLNISFGWGLLFDKYVGGVYCNCLIDLLEGVY
jgi:hypothetical protein